MHTPESRGDQRLRSVAVGVALTLLASGCGLLGTEDAGGAPSPTSEASPSTSAPTDADSTPTTVDAAVTASTASTAATPATTDAADGDGPSTLGTEGERGVGDPDFPTLGNGGFDVLRYELDLDVDPSTGRQTSRTLISARADADLAEFSLDFRGFDIDSITVDGVAAAYVRTPTDIVITPAAIISEGSEMLVEVAYSGRPRTVSSDTIGGDQLGWFTRPWGSYVSNEPEGASTWFPSNDHPTDKATYLFRVTVPSNFEVAVTGKFVAAEVIDDRTRWTWEMTEPMATYLAAVAIGDFEVVEETASNGMPITNFFPPDLADDADFDFGRTAEMIDYFVETFGPYPFSSYGVVVVPDDLFFAMENQTMSLFGADFIDGERGAEDVVAHELAHQWFGNHVSPSTWGDIWLNEGFATYSEFLWADHINPQADVYANLRRIAAEAPDEVLNPPGDPERTEMFSSGVYFRGALTLHALRLTVGDDVFFEIVRTWLVRFGGRDAGTADFIAVAEEVSGRELDEVINPWLYDAEVPELPSR